MKTTVLERLILTLETEQAAIARAVALLKAQRPVPARRVVTKIADRSTT
jgi:hypothetical protein